MQKRIGAIRNAIVLPPNAVEAKSRISRPDRYLAPLSIDERHDPIGPRCHVEGFRASDKGFLPMTLAAYVDLLDWTARQIRSDKRGSTPSELAPTFDRLGITSDVWCDLVRDFGKLFFAVAGRPEEIDSHRSRSGEHRYKAKLETRALMKADPQQLETLTAV